MARPAGSTRRSLPVTTSELTAATSATDITIDAITMMDEAPAADNYLQSSHYCLFRCLLPRMTRGSSSRRNQQQQQRREESNNPTDRNVVRDGTVNRRGGRSLLLLRGSRTRRRNHDTQPQEVTTTTTIRTSEAMSGRERRRRERKVNQERDARNAEIDKRLIVKMVQVQNYNDSSSTTNSLASNNANKPIPTTRTICTTNTAPPSTLKNPLSSYKVLDSNTTKTTSIGGGSSPRNHSTTPRDKIIYLNPAYCPTSDATELTTSTSTTSTTSNKPLARHFHTRPVVPQHLPPPQTPSYLHEPNCPICWEPYKQGDLVSCSPNCCHSYHVKCITTWLLKPNDECPMCRSDYLNRVKNGKSAKRTNMRN